MKEELICSTVEMILTEETEEPGQETLPLTLSNINPMQTKRVHVKWF
jgi:hypothetical protein